MIRYKLTIPLLLLASTAHGQVISGWDKSSSGGVVTTVEEGAVREGDYAATGIFMDWGKTLKEFLNDTSDEENRKLEADILDHSHTARTTTMSVKGKDGIIHVLPSYPDENGVDMFLLSEDGITIYMALDDPVFLKDYDEKDVIKWIRYYAYKHRNRTKRIFSRYASWEPHLKGYFNAEGIPPELTELCLIESGCTYDALSPAGALGMWQIMPETGRKNGLVINDYVDERRDPVCSTFAAAKILKKNYDHTGSWTLAAAAYNCGTGRMKKGQSWELHKPRLPKETQQYIPSLIAIHYVWTYREKLAL